MAGGRGDVGVGGFAVAGLILEFLFGGRLDGAVGEEEGLPSGCARVQGDGVVGLGINVGASGGAGEREPELLVGNGGEVRAVAEGLSGDGYRCTDVVGEGAGSLCGIKHVPEAAEAKDLRCVHEGGGQNPVETVGGAAGGRAVGGPGKALNGRGTRGRGVGVLVGGKGGKGPEVRRSNQAYAAAGPDVGCRVVRTSDTSWSSCCGRVVPWTATETATRNETESRTASSRSVACGGTTGGRAAKGVAAADDHTRPGRVAAVSTRGSRD